MDKAVLSTYVISVHVYYVCIKDFDIVSIL